MHNRHSYHANTHLTRTRTCALSFCIIVVVSCWVSGAQAELFAVEEASFNDWVSASSTHTTVLFVQGLHCAQCKVAEYTALLAAATYAHTDVKVGTVNISEAMGLVEPLGFPSLEVAEASLPRYLLFRPHALVPDVLDRSDPDHVAVVQWVNRMSGHDVEVSSVVTLKTHNYNRITEHPKRNVLVQFYTPWSPKCKALAEGYEALGRAFDHEKSVVIAKVDATENADLAAEVGVKGFPTLLFFPAGRGVAGASGELYDGELHAVDLLEYLNERCGTHRRLDASLSEHAGRVAAIDQLVRKFLVSKHSEQESMHKAALKVVDKLPQDEQEDARVYTDLMRGAIGSQDAVRFLHTERRRVQDKVSRTQGRGMYTFYRKRLNVLDVLAPAPLDVKLEEGEVVELDDDTFNRVVDGSRHVFVEFYAPWCGPCKRLAPIYRHLASQYVGTSNMVIASVDADEHKALATRHGVHDYPTLKYYGKGRSVDRGEVYRGELTSQAMGDFLNSRAASLAKGGGGGSGRGGANVNRNSLHSGVHGEL